MKKIKHNHTLTDFIKVGIFAIFLLMPFLIFVPNAFYYGFNEHAVAQEKTEQIPVYYESNEVNVINDLNTGNVYTWNDNLESIGTFTDNSSYMLIEVKSGQYSGSTAIFYLTRSGYVYLDINSTYNSIANLPFDFIFLSPRPNFNTMPNAVLEKITICNNQYIKDYQPLITNMSITDSMSYAWNSVWQNPLFSWVENSILKTPINNFVSVFGITEQAYIGQYLTYLFVIMTIYIVADIVIVALTTVTHMFNKEPK